MLSMPDAIAIVGICGAVITALLKMKGGGNGYVRSNACDERHKGDDKLVERIEDTIDRGFTEVKEEMTRIWKAIGRHRTLGRQDEEG